MRARRVPTMAEITAVVATTSAPRTARDSVRPGRFNLEGRFFDPDGNPLTRLSDELTEEEALERIRSGARVAAEPCGCGGTSRGCAPIWSDDSSSNDGATLRLPRRSEMPTWIDLWSGDSGDVVFLHGDARLD
ncbi:hypothetical protein [uncultured Amnibacterium sp.]|uniref:hypothetical protein n=1 Tax=uncultured Amnibacterium sp. TaxID=1631851 RepID=UPI0035CB7B20